MSEVLDFPVKPEARPYLDGFADAASEPQWLRQARRRALTRFAELGFPSRRSENWRYLDLQPLEQRPLLPARPAARLDATALREQLAPFAIAGAGARLVLADGRFVPELSHFEPHDGMWLGSTGQAMRERPDLVRAAIEGVEGDAAHPFAALNTAWFTDGFVLAVDPGVRLEQPIEIAHLAGSDDRSLHTRSAILLGAASRAAIVETYASAERCWRNDVIAVRLGERAELDRIVLVEDAAAALHLAQLEARLDEGAALTGFALLLGGHRVRHEANVRMGEGARCRLDAAYIVDGNDETNIVTTVDHAAPGGQTRELIKGVAAGRGHGAFQGRIVVREQAQHTDAHQLSRNLLLGRRAAIDTKPELEIYADDVKCAHGASVGDLDEAALFYLRARGIAAEEARRMLIEGFLRDAVEGVADPAVREHLLRRLARRLENLKE